MPLLILAVTETWKVLLFEIDVPKNEACLHFFLCTKYTQYKFKEQFEPSQFLHGWKKMRCYSFFAPWTRDKLYNSKDVRENKLCLLRFPVHNIICFNCSPFKNSSSVEMMSAYSSISVPRFLNATDQKATLHSANLRPWKVTLTWNSKSASTEQRYISYTTILAALKTCYNRL